VGAADRNARAAVLAIAVGAAAAAAPPRAQASPLDVFGVGSRHAAQAGAGVATVDDAAAPLVNPAGLARGRGKRFTVGVLGAAANLRINDRRTGLDQPVGGLVAFAAPAPLGGPLAGRLHVGFTMFVLPGSLARIVARFPDEPFYPYYQGRTERMVIVPALAVRARDDLEVGVAANFLAGLAGGIAASEGATRAIEARVDEQVPSIARLVAGVSWRPREDVRLGLAVRQRFEVPFATVARTEVAGEPIDLDLAASGQFSPAQASAGVSWSAGASQVSVDLAYARWSTYDGPFVAVKSALPLVGPLAAALPAVPWKDTFAARAGGELALGDGVLRGGYGFETSPVPAEQPGITNLLDGPKHTVGVGGGWRWPRALAGRELRLDVHLQAQLVGARRLAKRLLADGEGGSFDGLRDEVVDDPNDPATLGVQVSNAGYPSIGGGGQVFSGGVTLEVGL
jgi:long-subunit fatty acid transport protein